MTFIPLLSHHVFRTRGDILVERRCQPCDYPADAQALARRLDERRGVLLSSGFEFPGRYSRWDIGFSDPPLALSAKAREFRVDALNRRGTVLLPAIAAKLSGLPDVSLDAVEENIVSGRVAPVTKRFPEEMRSRQPSLFSVLRSLVDLFASREDRHLGLYGAFGYDLVFQFEPMPFHLARAEDQRDLVLYLPDEILVVDHMREVATILRYDFTVGDATTSGLSRDTPPASYRSVPIRDLPPKSDHRPGEYAAKVERARQAFARGDLFEVVLGQLLSEPCEDSPSVVFERLKRSNPAPYGTMMNLGEGEFLVGASPEMFVRVEGSRIETCPISGTIRRGTDALEDAERIRELLNSTKDESELTMCTDVDRNDKSRVCEAGSVKVIGRRQLELYSRLIHTVDHVEGHLRPEFDAFDGFLSHAWAVTVTGAPKPGAIRFVEREEKSARRWYGGAIGYVAFDGNMNTGLTLRTLRMKDGVAEVRVGATLLHDSDPVAEEAETRLKASAMLAVLKPPTPAATAVASGAARSPSNTSALGKNVLLIDHEDSFVHTLAGYFRATGAAVTTLRADLARAELQAGRPADLVVLSPGPGRPSDFQMDETLDVLLNRRIPVFGVCLGLQGLVEYFGGSLDVLAQPMHGKPSDVRVLGGRLLEGCPERFTVGRYHSLHARRNDFPDVLSITAESDDGVVMAVEHVALPLAAVQFHPESVMTKGGIGHRIIERALLLQAGTQH
jgi:anthranilate synthase